MDFRYDMCLRLTVGLGDKGFDLPYSFLFSSLLALVLPRHFSPLPVTFVSPCDCFSS